MKKTLFILSLLAGFVNASKAQKGSILLYGTMGFHSEKEPNDDKTTTFSISPGAGYQFNKKWTAGIAGGYGHEKFRPESGTETTSSSYQAGGFARFTNWFNPI